MQLLFQYQDLWGVLDQEFGISMNWAKLTQILKIIGQILEKKNKI